MAGRSPYPKVVHIVVAGQIGGAERFLVSLASRPELSGAEHCIALMTPNPALRALFVNAGLKVHDRGPVRENPLAYLWRSYGPSDLAWLGQVVRDEGGEVLHAHTYGSHVLAARAGIRLGLPVVRTEHGTRHYRDPSCALNRHWALRHTTLVAAVSRYVGDFVVSRAPYAAQKVRVVPNGIDATSFLPVAPPHEGPFTFAAVGRLDPVKRLHIAIEAIARNPDVRLDLVGDGPERRKLEALTTRLGVAGRVRFLGHLSDPRTAIGSCDALINTTFAEGMPLAVLEGAAMGRPTLGFAGGGMPEAVQDGLTGWLVNEDSIAAWTAAVTHAATSRTKAAAMGAAARPWVESRFGLGAMCSGYAKVYGELRQTAGQYA